MNLNMSELEQAQEMSGTEEYLRNIWKTLNVGLNGYITSQELGQVCDHIGMEMNKTVSSWQLALSEGVAVWIIVKIFLPLHVFRFYFE